MKLTFCISAGILVVLYTLLTREGKKLEMKIKERHVEVKSA